MGLGTKTATPVLINSEGDPRCSDPPHFLAGQFAALCFGGEEMTPEKQALIDKKINYMNAELQKIKK